MDLLLRLNQPRATYRLRETTWQAVKSLGLSDHKPTRRGTRGGVRLVRKITPLVNHAASVNLLRPPRPRSINSHFDIGGKQKQSDGICVENLIQINTSHVSSVPSLNCLLLNARSVCNKSTLISEYILDSECDIALITETWLKPDDHTTEGELCPPGYSLTVKSRESGRGGGVGILHKSSLEISDRSIPFAPTTFEVLTVTLLKPLLTLALVYRPPSTSIQVFLDEFADYLASLETFPGKYLISGDFNINVRDTCTSASKRFYDLLDNHSMRQYVVDATHRQGNVLDLVIARPDDDLLTSVPSVLDHQISDHHSVVFTIQGRLPDTDVTRSTGRDYRDINIENFKSEVKEAIENLPLREICDPNELFEAYDAVLTHSLDKHAPLVTRRRTRRRKNPWDDDQLRALRRERRRLERLWRKTKLCVHKQMYITARKVVIDYILVAKRTYYIHRLDSATQKITFSTLRDLLNEKTTPIPTNGDAESTCGRFAYYFSDKIDKIMVHLDASQSGITRDIGANEADRVNHYPALRSFTLLTDNELRQIIMSSSSKSCELDTIPTWLLKSTIEVHLPVLTLIINASLQTGEVLTSTKTALVRPHIKKRSLDPSIDKNFRPVSNLSFLGKIAEKAVASRFNTHLHSNNLLEPNQSAYRRDHSTETALMKVVSDIATHLDNNMAVVVLLFDMSAAFDTIIHQNLVDRLQSYFNVEGVPLAWFQSYLEGRSQKVTIGSGISQPMPLKYGVPQGSVLGPMLFTAYTVPLQDIINPIGVSYHKYADDLQIYAPYDPSDPDSQIQAWDKLSRCIQAVNSWMTRNYLKLNPEKTDMIIIQSKYHQRMYEAPPFHMDNQTFVSSPSLRNLGVQLDDHLDMSAQVSNVVKACNFQLYKIGRIRNFITSSACQTLVQSTVVSRLDYACALLPGISRTLVQKLQVVQNRAARLITGTKLRDNITPVLRSLHWLPVRARIEFRLMTYVYKCLHDRAPLYLRDMLHLYTTGRPLRSSSDESLLHVPRTRKNIGLRAFSATGPRLWNDIPRTVRESDSLAMFKRRLKTHYFVQCYP